MWARWSGSSPHGRLEVDWPGVEVRLGGRGRAATHADRDLVETSGAEAPPEMTQAWHHDPAYRQADVGARLIEDERLEAHQLEPVDSALDVVAPVGAGLPGERATRLRGAVGGGG